MRIHLDMSNVGRVDAIGLTVFIAQLSQIFSSGDHRLLLTNPRNVKILHDLEDLGFQEILTSLGIYSVPERDLFTDFEVPPTVANLPKYKKNSDSHNKILFVLPLDKGSRNSELAKIKAEIKEFLKIDKMRNFAHEQVMIILLELVKNTLDHSNKVAILGLKMTLGKNNRSQFSFVYCDTGDGICHSVRRHMALLAQEISHIPETERVDMVYRKSQFDRLAEKGSFSDFIHWALQPGNSTKIGNGVNFGLGLMLIVEASKNCGFRVSVKDADTLMVLTELLTAGEGAISLPYTHSLIRQLGIKTCAAPLLVFHGDLELDK